jgi:ComF family protein
MDSVIYHNFKVVSRCKVLHINDIGDDFLSLFLPRLCLGCRAHLVRGEKVLCTQCLLSMARTDFHHKRDNTLEQAFWGRCLVERAAAFSVYNRGSRIRKLIHALKYDGRTEIGKMLGELYGNILTESGFMDDIDMIVPVPLHPARQRQRGYNQSDYIANGLSEASGVTVKKNTIRRTSQTASQTKHGRYERWENVKSLFFVPYPEEIKGKHILVVDDVITTGSTMEACVNALHEAGEVKVSLVALAAAQKLTL